MTEGSPNLKYPASPRSIQDPRAIIQDTLHPTGDSLQHRETLANISRASSLSNTSLEVDSVSDVGTVWSGRAMFVGFFFGCGVGTGDVRPVTILRGEQETTLLLLLG